MEIATLLVGAFWPSVVVVLALVFKSEIRSLLARLTSVGTKGADFLPPPPQSTNTSNALERIEATEKRSVANPVEPTNDPLIKRTEEFIREQLAQLDLTPEQRENLLVNEAATFRVATHFERIYSLIYLSQVEALRQLNSTRWFVSTETLEHIYNKAADEYPDTYSTIEFDQWLKYLEANSLVSCEDSTVAITDAGISFLKYLIDAQKPGPFTL